MSAALDEIFCEGITESIVTTVSNDGIPNAAPMGVVRRGDSIFIRMYPGTKTLRNVADTGCLVANITTDPMVYVVTAFEDLNCSGYAYEHNMPPPRLKNASAYAYFNAKANGAVELDPVDAVILERTVPRFSRSFAAIIEATITGTRLRFYRGDEGLKKIHECEVIVNKCGGQRDNDAMKKLKEILDIQ